MLCVIPGDPKTPVTVAFERFPFTYPDGRHNAETLLVHPVTGATSYHLRKLASVGLVEETGQPRSGAGGRPTECTAGWRDAAGDPDAEAASDWLRRYYLALRRAIRKVAGRIVATRLAGRRELERLHPQPLPASLAAFGADVGLFVRIARPATDRRRGRQQGSPGLPLRIPVAG
jgi:hypothetical protein